MGTYSSLFIFSNTGGAYLSGVLIQAGHLIDALWYVDFGLEWLAQRMMMFFHSLLEIIL